MKAAALLFLALPAGCASGALEPAALDTRNEACTACRMAVSESRFAAQVVAPGEVPRFFDDLGCLAGYLTAGRMPEHGAVFVADHRTRAWARAQDALYTRVPDLATPMGSQLIAHADAASRDQDPAARGGTPVAAAEVLGGGSAR